MRISELKGVGDKTEKLFNKLSIYSVEDLISFYPRRYDSFSAPVYIANMKEGDVRAFWGVVVSECELNLRHPRKILSVYVCDEQGKRIKLTWYNRPYNKSKLIKGYRYIFRGEVAYKGNLVFMQQPDIYTQNEYQQLMDTLRPVYPLTADLGNNTIIKAVRQAFDVYRIEQDYLPENIREENSFMPYAEAVRKLHFPTDENELAQARRRIAFDEFFLFTLGIKSAKNANLLANNNFIIHKSPYSAKILANLTFELTNAQKAAYDEIIQDMESSHSMNRLVQGDVGCGKTILAMLAMADAAYYGYQSALMAPTEVLAKQHYESFVNFFESNNIPIECVLLTGSLSASEHRKVYAKIVSKEAMIVIGTHAVITDKVEFNELALVVTDEQHRFGVRQREALHNKGLNPHILVMSATPIPRSLAIILYGELDISIINEKPAERLPIKNCVVDDSYHANAYRFIEKEVRNHHQAYIICALAQESEDEDSNLKDVVTYSNELKEVFAEDIRIEYLHGKMRPSQKNDIMNRFSEGEIDILVSTTVVEVGINVPNATVMMVEDAERFGLAGLHQLRGRVGRGDAQAYCIFVSNSKNPATKERLNILRESNDGFYISEQDLKLRGPGELLGVRQSGDFGFRVGDIYADALMLKKAADISDDIISDDPTLALEEHILLRQKLTEYMAYRQKDINL